MNGDLTVLESVVPSRILDGLEQSRGWRLKDHQGILGLWKLKPERKWKG